LVQKSPVRSIWWDDYSGKLAFAKIEEVASRKRKVHDLGKLTPYHVDVALLAAQEACFVYADDYLGWINYEGRKRAGTLKANPLNKPRPRRRAKLKLP
jgi:hypothetical protein